MTEKDMCEVACNKALQRSGVFIEKTVPPNGHVFVKFFPPGTYKLYCCLVLAIEEKFYFKGKSKR
jgi:hypothetical protein